MSGTLALAGGNAWTDGCSYDRDLLEGAGTDEVLLLPTAAAYIRPDKAVALAEQYFAGLGAGVRALPVYRRPDAELAEHVDAVRAARLIYISGGSPMHLMSVLKGTALWQAIVEAWDGGATLVGSSGGGAVMCDPMVDTRGGAFTVGLGLLSGMTVVPHADQWSADKLHRTLLLAPAGLAVVTVEARTAILRSPDGAWTSSGAGAVHVYVDNTERGLDALPG